MKLVSGGQTGVDRAALDFGLEAGIAVGGWCPEGRKAEDGPLDAKYPLEVLPGAGYSQRTRQNVIDSDGTLIVYFGYLSGGTANTVAHCLRHKKPMLVLDALELDTERAGERILQFVADYGLKVMNVAGPRGSGESRAYEYTKAVLSSAFSD